MNHDAVRDPPVHLPPTEPSAAPLGAPASDTMSVLGVPVSDIAMDDAIKLLEQLLLREPKAHAVFFVNAHTLNLACDDPSYREVLRGAEHVFGDGTGVRWSARLLHGRALRDNVNGTDVVPRLFIDLAGRGLSYFLLGNTLERIERAAAHARATYPGWTQAGYHHGYLGEGEHAAAVERVNASGAHLLLVGMGNPKQERWIARHLPQLTVPLCMGTGGLFDYWAGNLVRAPVWVRRVGCEWLYLLIHQPHKARRYLLGNPKFLLRVVRSWLLKQDCRD